ncbi:gfo/Idh/MocA family oxidoreductase [Nocardia yunnanensis]|uniref:Gfo/Idh/MocA family oxidoreductase n=1 Tax=Nocardia yunnanensis TaxID=2382165 RepID=A0A386ZBH6_9NOCA|nr:Gfo/Idh/MocA family oxidoreductase [Nocardia yunnanensis]AYF74846.1 gfo/Idh/MocA family oxidoreductase [Nocardia yunnanensis]
MADRLRVGIIGASPDRGWAARAHIPALHALPDFELTAVGTSRRESAERAAREFGAEYAFTDASALAEHPEVDLVVITVKVPAHAELIGAALAAGKHVYSEWPLTRTTSEAEAIVAAAAAAPGRHVVGLQARFAPAVQRARELLAEGHVGEPVSATVYSSRGKGAGGRIPQWAAYTLDRDNAAGLLEVAGGHTLDPLEYLLGGLTELSADLAIRNSHNTVLETGERVRATSPDHLLLNARIGEVVVSAHLHDAKLTGAHTRIEISGTAGDLVLANDTAAGAPGLHAGGIQMSDLTLLASRPDGSWQDLTPADPAPLASLPVESRNVARFYARLAEDITGADTVPSFETGLRMHRILDVIRRSADSGARQPIPN